MQIPAGTDDYFYQTTSAPGYADLFDVNLHIDLSNAITGEQVSPATPEFVDMTYGLVRVTRDPSDVLIVSRAYDCNLRLIEHAVGVISSASGQRAFVPGPSAYYGADGTFAVPVLPDVRGDTNTNGLIGFFNVPVATGDYIQLWGFPDDASVAQGEAGLVLVAEYPLTPAAQLLGFPLYANR